MRSSRLLRLVGVLATSVAILVVVLSERDQVSSRTQSRASATVQERPAAQSASSRTLTVLVSDRFTGSRLEGATVRCMSDTQEEIAREYTTARGVAWIRISNDAHEAEIETSLPGFQADRTAVRLVGVGSLVVAVQLTGTGVVRGIVRSANDDRPIPSAWISLGTPGAVSVEGRADSEGEFEVCGLPPGVECAFFAGATGYSRFESRVVPTPSGVNLVARLKLLEPGTVFVRGPGVREALSCLSVAVRAHGVETMRRALRWSEAAGAGQADLAAPPELSSARVILLGQFDAELGDSEFPVRGSCTIEYTSRPYWLHLEVPRVPSGPLLWSTRWGRGTATPNGQELVVTIPEAGFHVDLSWGNLIATGVHVPTARAARFVHVGAGVLIVLGETQGGHLEVWSASSGETHRPVVVHDRESRFDLSPGRYELRMDSTVIARRIAVGPNEETVVNLDTLLASATVDVRLPESTDGVAEVRLLAELDGALRTTRRVVNPLTRVVQFQEVGPGRYRVQARLRGGATTQISFLAQAGLDTSVDLPPWIPLIEQTLRLLTHDSRPRRGVEVRVKQLPKGSAPPTTTITNQRGEVSVAVPPGATLAVACGPDTWMMRADPARASIELRQAGAQTSQLVFGSDWSRRVATVVTVSGGSAPRWAAANRAGPSTFVLRQVGLGEPLLVIAAGSADAAIPIAFPDGLSASVEEVTEPPSKCKVQFEVVDTSRNRPEFFQLRVVGTRQLRLTGVPILARVLGGPTRGSTTEFEYYGPVVIEAIGLTATGVVGWKSASLECSSTAIVVCKLEPLE